MSFKVVINNYTSDSNKRVYVERLQLPTLPVALSLADNGSDSIASLQPTACHSRRKNSEAIKLEYAKRDSEYQKLWTKIRNSKLIMPHTILATLILARTYKEVPVWLAETELSLEDQHRICERAFEFAVLRRFFKITYEVKDRIYNKLEPMLLSAPYDVTDIQSSEMTLMVRALVAKYAKYVEINS